MQNLENSSFKVAEEILMTHIRTGKYNIIKNREALLSGSTNITEEDAKACFKKFFQELESVILNKTYDDEQYLREIILKTKANQELLKYFLSDYDEQVKYGNILEQIQHELTLKLFASIEKTTQKVNVK